MPDAAPNPTSAPPLLPLPSPFPPAVRHIGLFAPASAVVPELLAAGIRQLEAWGLTVHCAANLTARHRFLAGTDAERVAGFHELLRNPQVQALMAIRGGFGCARLFDQLDFELLRRRDLPLIGYSDLTALHLAGLRQGLTACISGPMAAVEFARPPRDAAESADLAFTLRSFAEVWTPRAAVALPPGCRLQVLKPGRAAGPVVPATLSVLVSMVGTPWLPDLTGALLLLEDVKEAAHRLDRYLTQLRAAGILQRLAGLAFGQFTKMDDAEYIPDILAECAECVPGPVIAGVPFGHDLPGLSVPVGRPAVLEAETAAEPRLSW